MQSKFTFLEEDFPKLSEYGRKAEECQASDPNICLLHLGKIAGLITEMLCRKYHLQNYGSTGEISEGLLERGIITDEVHRKILALSEFHDDFAADEMTCSRLMVSAEELCRWFTDWEAEGRFAFLGELYPPDKPVPPLMNLAVLGGEAEEYLYSNTRYCLICLGDVGEAAADRIIYCSGIETHEKDQIDRIDVLSERGIIDGWTRDVLHELRIARNKALHERYNTGYNSGEECKRLLDGALELCGWIFRRTAKAGYIVRGKVTGEDDDGFTVSLGNVPAYLPKEGTPEGLQFMAGEKHNFRIADIEDDRIILGLCGSEGENIPSVGRLYAKYIPGQDVHVTIKSISNSTGALVELKDGLEAQIPLSETGRRLYDYESGTNMKMIRYETTARVKWFSLTEYPPLLLSVKDIEEEQSREQEEAKLKATKPEGRPAMSDLDFRLLCKSATYEQVIRALDEGANPNAMNGRKTTALMMAAQNNSNVRVIKALIDAGAEVDAKNHKGNTALMYAAMENSPEVVRAIYDAGADIEALNNDGKKAADYAVANRRLNGTDLPLLLRGDVQELTESTPEPEAIDEPAHEVQEVPEATPEPDATNEPGSEVQELTEATPEPEATTEPGHEPQELTEATPEPDATNEPGSEVQEVPEATLDPEATNEPGYEVQEVPEATLEPEATNEPGHEVQELPEATPEPEATDEPGHEVQEVPEATPETEATDEPGHEVQEVPEATPEPDAPNEPVPATQTQDVFSQPDDEPDEAYNDYYEDEPPYYEIEAPGSDDQEEEEDRPLTQEQEEESRNVLRITLQKDFLKICRSGSEDEIAEAVNAGVNVNVSNRADSTALMFAAQSNTAGAVEILIRAGADLNAQDSRGNTALIYAASYNTDDTVDALIDAGADRKITNYEGYKAADYARMNYRLNDTEALKRL